MTDGQSAVYSVSQVVTMRPMQYLDRWLAPPANVPE